MVVRLEQQIDTIERHLGDTSRNLHGESRRSFARDLVRRKEELVEAKARVEELVQEGYGSGYVR